MINFNDNGSSLYPQPLVVVDESLCDAIYPDGIPLPKIRQLTEEELVLFIISETDVNQGGLGSIIHEISETGKIDAWGQLSTQVQFDFNGVPLEARLGYNSIFSLDGLHFNPRGNAFVANRFIQKMNDNFGCNIPLIDVNQFVGNTVEE